MSVTLTASLIGVAIVAGAPFQAASGETAASTDVAAATYASAATGSVTGVRSYGEVKHDSSLPLAALIASTPEPNNPSRRAPMPRPVGPKPPPSSAPTGPDPSVQRSVGSARMPSTSLNFEGIRTYHLPPDPNGDVGLDNYVEAVNTSLAIYDKSGNIAPGSPFMAKALFAGFGGVCETDDVADPIIQYDALADRWVFSEVGDLHWDFRPPWAQCFAISQTSDPTGSWYRYEYKTPGRFGYDYPKIGIWPDAYYMTADRLGAGFPAGAFAFDRAAMLSGTSASIVYFEVPNAWRLLPSDVENASAPPPPGEPAHLIRAGDWKQTLRIYDFHVDFATPTNSTLTWWKPLPVDPYNPWICWSRYCIPQKGTTQRLWGLEGWLMYQLEYFNYGSHEDMVVSRVVKAGKSSGIRWYQLRSTGGGAWSVYQQGTYAPDGQFRWLPSGALDKNGNYAVGYNASSTKDYPSIRYAGRLDTDPLGQLSQGEGILIAGGGSQTGGWHRWGDYSSMQIDPSDGCTFWYTGEYYPTSSFGKWHTRIGTFKFPGCV